MKKVLFLLVIIALSAYALFADPTVFNGYIDRIGTANTEIVFVYNNEIIRIGFTGQAFDTSSFDVPVEIREVNLKSDYSTKKATSEEFYAYWQINNKNAYKIYLSSTGLNKDDGSDANCNWSVSTGDTVGFINKNEKSKLLHYKKANTTKEGIGFKKLVVTIEYYPSLKAGNYTLPLTLELVTL